MPVDLHTVSGKIEEPDTPRLQPPMKLRNSLPHLRRRHIRPQDDFKAERAKAVTHRFGISRRIIADRIYFRIRLMAIGAIANHKRNTRRI
ncbi:hypothetical protein GGD41_002985 [Paraburkholderia bryophila]|uniref:Uncharacterized protein n=1 Tax=Paraburkholderia bryophila TaxID=420952 RepID=A0A7Z0B0W0_9BURK|nr:hypothetical protein [Paraburkholderia bryophila]